MLKIALMVWNNNVICKILDMDEKLRGKCNFQSENKISILSVSCPAITSSALFIRGSDRSKDDNISICVCENKTMAFKHANAISESVKEFNKIYGYKKECVINIQNPFEETKPTNEKLKINILKWQNSLLVQVVDIGEVDRGRKSITFDNFTLKSVSRTEAHNSRTLFVRGTEKSRDNEISMINFNDFINTQKYINNVIKATKLWNCSSEDYVQVVDFFLR